MNASRIERIQTSVERAACVLFAAAVAFAVFKGLSGTLGEAQLGGCCMVAGIVAYALCSRLLGWGPAALKELPMASFEPAEIEPFESDELVLTEADRVDTQAAQAEQQPLVLDDILAEIGPDARVVRLFDRKAMPTPGHLQSRIDDHLERGRAPSVVPDASQALYDALAELRRSLR